MHSELPPGTRLGRYEIRSQLGVGGMGEVYLALDTELDRTVAPKILPRDLSIVRLKVDARFDSLRSDPRFPALVRRVGLEP